MKHKRGPEKLLVRVVPLSADDSDNDTIEVQQAEYFLGELKENGGKFRCRTSIAASPGTPVLFQYRGHVVAFARYIETKALTKDPLGYPSAMYFVPETITVFQPPITADQMRDLWPREFKRFSHAKLTLSPAPLKKLFKAKVARGESIPRRQPAMDEDLNFVGGRVPTTETHMRKAVEAVEVSRDHARMQEKLKSQLVSLYGENVVVEHRGVDLLITEKSSITLFEIKPYDSPKAVIRDAIGQLLEYAFREPNRWQGKRLKLVIVGRVPLDPLSKSYLSRLARQFHLPLSYQTVSI